MLPKLYSLNAFADWKDKSLQSICAIWIEFEEKELGSHLKFYLCFNLRTDIKVIDFKQIVDNPGARWIVRSLWRRHNFL